MENENQVPDEVRAYMSRLGARTSATKAESSRTNAAKGAAARRVNPLDLECTCGGGESLNANDHKTTCPRGKLLYQRAYQRERAAKLRATKPQAKEAA